MTMLWSVSSSTRLIVAKLWLMPPSWILTSGLAAPQLVDHTLPNGIFEGNLQLIALTIADTVAEI